MTQKYTQTQRNSNPSVFSTKTGPSETIRHSRWHLGWARGSVLDVTFADAIHFIVASSVLSVFNVTKATDENGNEIPVKAAVDLSSGIVV